MAGDICTRKLRSKCDWREKLRARGSVLHQMADGIDGIDVTLIIGSGNTGDVFLASQKLPCVCWTGMTIEKNSPTAAQHPAVHQRR